MNQRAFPEHIPRNCPQCGLELPYFPPARTCPNCGVFTRDFHKNVRVENGKIIIQDPAVLPNRCIKTNQPADLPPNTVSHYDFPRWIYIFAVFLIPLILFVVYLVVRKEVQITYCVNKKAHNLAWLKAGIAALIGCFSYCTCCFSIMLSSPLGGVLSMVIGLISFILFFYFLNQIGVRKHTTPDEYVLSGCCKEFIEQLRKDQESNMSLRHPPLP